MLFFPVVPGERLYATNFFGVSQPGKRILPIACQYLVSNENGSSFVYSIYILILKKI